MKRLLVVYHSMTGAAGRLGARRGPGAQGERDVEVRLLRAPDASSAEVLAADGYLFAAPEDLASMAGLMKDFFDRIYDALSIERPAVRRRHRRAPTAPARLGRSSASRPGCD